MILKRSAETWTQINTCRKQNANHYTRKARTPKDYFILYYYIIYYLIIKGYTEHRTLIWGFKVQYANHYYIFTSDVLKSCTENELGSRDSECWVLTITPKKRMRYELILFFIKWFNMFYRDSNSYRWIQRREC